MTDPRLAIKPPAWIKGMNEQVLAEHGDAIPVLTIAGRRSGEPRSVPLSVYERDGQRFVVGGFPAADWVSNARAAGAGSLSAHGRTEAVRIVELPDADAEPVLRAWPGFVPRGVEMMRDAGVVGGVTPDDLAGVVGVCPVFRLDPV